MDYKPRRQRAAMGGNGWPLDRPLPPSAAFCRLLPPYSYLSASMGSSRAARLAGYRPKPIPVNAEAVRAASTDHTGTWAGIGVMREIAKATPPPTSMPTAPPTRVRVEEIGRAHV